MLKKLLLLLALPLFLAAAMYAALVWYYNRELPPPDASEVRAAFDRGVDWLQQNEQSIIDNDSALLWYLLQRSAAATADERLTGLFQRYADLRLHSRNPWRILFDDQVWIRLSYDDVVGLPYYNRYILYGLTCGTELGSVPAIAAQGDVDYCSGLHFRPACITHQVIGLRVRQGRQCEAGPELDATVEELLRRIARWQTLDPRIVDVYLQRLMVLLEAGATEQVKPVWIRAALDAQREDGGWGNLHPLLPLPDGRALGFNARFFGVGKPRSGFHPTAQGVFIMALLMHPNPVPEAGWQAIGLPAR